MAELRLENVSKTFASGEAAVRDVTLYVPDGELLVLVGPSGCGKSTILRMISGLETPTKGSILLGGRPIDNVAESARDIAMIFQNYALYPHLSVYDNISFPLKIARVPKRDRDEKVRAVAETLGLTTQLDTKPSELSGGQRQRVAMGRAIVRQPQLFLMDEPLSNLDARLRADMRIEIAAIQRSLGITTVYVTHDQAEAMTLGDRVAVMNKGVLLQVGTPDEIYAQPDDLFVAGCLGSPTINTFAARLIAEEGSHRVAFEHQIIDLDSTEINRHRVEPGRQRDVIVGIRAEALIPVPLSGGDDHRKLVGTVLARESLGSDVLALVDLGTPSRAERDPSERLFLESASVEGSSTGTSRQVTARFPAQARILEGEQVALQVARSSIHLFEPSTGATWSRRGERETSTNQVLTRSVGRSDDHENN